MVVDSFTGGTKGLKYLRLFIDDIKNQRLLKRGGKNRQSGGLVNTDTGG